MKIRLRNLSEADLPKYEYWRMPQHKYHEYNGPYFQKLTKQEVEADIKRIVEAFEQGNSNPVPDKMIISNEKDELLGEVNWYWKSKETNWLEVGVVIFDENNWGKGIGGQALKLWIDEVLRSREELVRIGLTTWSGNMGMINLAEKLGLKKEAEYRKARIVDGKYYDSVSYGILREEWEEMEGNTRK